jgi:hypothetical protein
MAMNLASNAVVGYLGQLLHALDQIHAVHLGAGGQLIAVAHGVDEASSQGSMPIFSAIMFIWISQA